MKNYRYLLFDLDGTLTYSHKGIYACMRYALDRYGISPPSDAELRKCVGPPLVYSFSRFFGLDEENAKRATAIYRERYSTVGWKENEPIFGAKELLCDLQKAGYALALATSKPKIFADKIADEFGFTPYLSASVGSGIDGSFPTKASVIEEAVRQLNANKAECLMIGDRVHDVEGARQAGVDVAGLDVGYADDGELAACAPDYYCKSMEELRRLLLK